MLYVIHGTDIQKSRNKLQNLVAVLQSKRPDATLFKLSPDNWNPSLLDEMLSGVNLFTPKNIIVLDSLVSNKESVEYIEDRIGDFAKSEHVCILYDTKIGKALLSNIEKKAEKIEEHNLKGLEVDDSKKQPPQTFALADAILAKNKVKSWTILQTLISDGVVAEEIHGVLWWQFKSLFLACMFSSAKEAGLNPYVFQKCQSAKKNWSIAEVQVMLASLIQMYHRAHRGELDFMSEIEQLCLG